MARAKKKIKLTWAELKHQRNALERFELYLPTLRLKQQQLQMAIGKVQREYEEVLTELRNSEASISAYEPLFRDRAGIHLEEATEPEEVRTRTKNLGGVRVNTFESASFSDSSYSLFGTPPWVDRALADLKRRNQLIARLELVEQQMTLLQAELKKVSQRVNLFEKIIIPETRGNIRRIRIALGDAMTAAVARAKIAKAKLEDRERKRMSEADAV
ncbi:MAG: V-type ATP synthase subunit D [Deltaproteobacteria bacterium]|nr:V-type ATP synthase subunit D [Deltaproteobacteria bacterium]